MGPEGVKADRYERFRRLNLHRGQAGVKWRTSTRRLPAHWPGPIPRQVSLPSCPYFNAIASGDATVSGILESEDVEARPSAFSSWDPDCQWSHSWGWGDTETLNQALYEGSGTTMRLLLGLLAGQKLEATLTGDASLSRRPMARVTEPLKTLGATFTGPDDRAPLNLQGGRIVNCAITSTVASAQVKTAVMLAAIQGKGTLTYTEPALSRDHTERLLSAMGVVFDRTVQKSGAHTITLVGPQPPKAIDVDVPGDISAAAFFLVAGSIVKGQT